MNDIGYNNLRVHIYDFDGVPISDPHLDLEHCANIIIGTQADAGIFTDCSFEVDKNLSIWSAIKSGHKIEITNGIDNVAYEGTIINYDDVFDNQRQYNSVYCKGATTRILSRQPIENWYSDNRMSEEAWKTVPAYPPYNIFPDKATVSRTENVFRIVPKGVEWQNKNTFCLLFEAPFGRTARRAEFGWLLATATGSATWHFELQASDILAGYSGYTYESGVRVTPGLSTGTFSGLLPMESRYLRFTFYAYYNEAGTGTASTNTTPIEDGTIYLEVRNLRTFSLSGTVNMANVFIDVIHDTPGISQDISHITQGQGEVSPFMARGYPSTASILNEITNRGDPNNSLQRWVWGVYESRKSNDGKPVVFLKPYPDTLDYEYVIRRDEGNIVGRVGTGLDGDSIINYVTVQFINSLGQLKVIAPDLYPSLKDQASINKYGILAPETAFNAGVCTEANALKYGQQILSIYKTGVPKAKYPLSIKEWIRSKSGELKSVANIRSLERVKIEDTEEVFIITQTYYTDDNEINQLSFGNQLDPTLPFQIIPETQLIEFPSSGGTSVGGNTGGGGSIKISQLETTNWKNKFGKLLKDQDLTKLVRGQKGFEKFRASMIKLAKARRKKAG